MTEDDFEKLKEAIIKAGGQRRGPTPWTQYTWWLTYYNNEKIYLKYTSSNSKYKGSILEVAKIKNDKINAICSISGALKIHPSSHYRNFEFTKETRQRYVDNTIGTQTVKDFFNNDINIGDYVYGEFDRSVIFGQVKSTKIADGKKRGYSSKVLKHDAAMIEILKIDSRDGFKLHPGHQKLLEMKYFIKIEDPTFYILKL